MVVKENPDRKKNSSDPVFLFPVQKNVKYTNFTFEELEKALKSVKRNKTAGHDDTDSDVLVDDKIIYSYYSWFFTVHLMEAFFQSS